MNLYEQIINPDNLSEAYLELYENFLIKSQTNKYKGVDGIYLGDTELSSREILAQTRQEIIDYSPLRTTKYNEILKTNGKIRKVYMMPTHERIKCQAIYRVLKKHINPMYSKYLFSFREEKPSYYALRSTRKFYLNNINKNCHILKIDFTNYAENIDQNILFKRLASYGVDDKSLELVKMFVRMPYCKEGKMMCLTQGVLQGTPLSSIFDNIYMAHIDDVIGGKAAFYRRVGDDIIVMDTNIDTLKTIKKYIEEECKNSKLILNPDKTIFQAIEKPFVYLGLEFNNGLISIPKEKYIKIVKTFKRKFSPKSKQSTKRKIEKIKKVLKINKKQHSMTLENYALTYNLVTDSRQIQKLSKHIFHILAAFIGGGHSFAKFAKAKKSLNKVQHTSWMKFHTYKK